MQPVCPTPSFARHSLTHSRRGRSSPSGCPVSACLAIHATAQYSHNRRQAVITATALHARQASKSAWLAQLHCRPAKVHNRHVSIRWPVLSPLPGLATRTPSTTAQRAVAEYIYTTGSQSIKQKHKQQASLTHSHTAIPFAFLSNALSLRDRSILLCIWSSRQPKRDCRKTETAEKQGR